MPYVGKTAFTTFTETVKDSFNGDNSTVAFTMSQSVSLDTDIEVFVGNVQQEPGSGKAYTVSGTTLTFSEAPPTGTANIYVIHRNSLQGTLLPPQNLGDRNYLIGGNLSLDADSAVLNFGADSEITVTHVADTGLNIKHTATGDDKPVVLTLQTGETDIAADDVIGQIDFQAPDEGTGTDAVLVSGAIQARAETDFSSSVNKTSLDLMTGASEAATTKLTITSDGRGLSQFTAKAWANINGNTFGERDSHNFSGFTDNGTGDYTFTFANSMANTNYAVVSTAANGTSHGDFQGVDAIVNATGNVRIRTCFVTGTDSSSSAHNVLDLHIAVFGD